MRALGEYLDVSVRWVDDSPYGTALTGRVQRTIQQQLHPRAYAMLAQWMQADATVGELSIAELNAIVREERAQPGYRAIVADSKFLRPTLPEPSAQISAVDLRFGDSRVRVPIANSNTLTALSELLRGVGSLQNFTHTPEVGCLLRFVEQQRTLCVNSEPSHLTQDVVIGHACVSLAEQSHRLWIDPFFRPKQPRYGEVQPLSVLDLPAVHHTVLLTHSHPDHFDPASLLLFPPDTRFFVPYSDGETIVSVDLANRLHALGFTQVTSCHTWQRYELDGFTITCCPFWGEQAVGPWSNEPLLWNEGATWHVRRGDDSFLFLADSGSDPRGHSLALADEIKERAGSTKVIFGNCRKWRLYPAQFITSSVPQYLVICPDESLDMRQTIMLEPHELGAFAERLGARYVAPYAMGGAAWYSELGLGHTDDSSTEKTEFDVDPTAALRGAKGELRLAPAFNQLLLKPSCSLDLIALGANAVVVPCQKPSDDPFTPDTLTLYQVSAESAVQLAELSRLAPEVRMMLAPGFCEFWFRHDNMPEGDSTLLRNCLDAWVQHHAGAVVWGTTPQSVRTFWPEPAWRTLAWQAMGAVSSAASFSSAQRLSLLRALLSEPPFTAVSAELLANVYLELTQVKIDTVISFNQSTSAPSLPQIDFTVPREPWMERYSNSQIGLALLIAKTLHIAWLSQLALRQTDLLEQDFVRDVFQS